jgi:hypothetical protein
MGPAKAQQTGRRNLAGGCLLTLREEDAVTELPDESLVASIDRVVDETAEMDTITSGKVAQHPPGTHRSSRLGRVR